MNFYNKALDSKVSERIKKIRKELKLSQQEFGNLIEIPQGTVNKIENGQNLNLRLFIQLLNKFKIDQNWLLTGRGEMFLNSEIEEKTVKIKSYANALAGAGAGIEVFEDGEAVYYEIPAKWFRSTKNKTCIAFTVRGDSMEPYLTNGGIAFADISEKHLRDGCVYLMRWGDETLVKQVQTIREGVKLLSFNPKYEPRVLEAGGDELKVIGRVALGLHLF